MVRFPSKRFVRQALASMLWTQLAAALPAQQTVAPESTLHVYTNLLQLPVLVLSSKREALPPIPASRFLLRIGDLPPFHPRVRQEGDDPITLAVLIDGSPEGPKLPGLADALAAMARDRLLPTDRVALYGIDGCRLRRSSVLRPANGEIVRAAVEALANYPPWQQHWRGEKCTAPVGVWDATAWVTQSLQNEPGRRVLLLVSNGLDLGSKFHPDDVLKTANGYGVAIFSLAEWGRIWQGVVLARSNIQGGLGAALTYISEGSGGMVLETRRDALGKTLGSFPALLRGRYIFEFPRPVAKAGFYALRVSDGQPKDFIRSAGTAAPPSDPYEPDPSVEHGVSDPLKAAAAMASDEPAPEAPSTVAPAATVALPAPAAPAIAPVPRPAADPTDITDEVESPPHP